MADRLMYWMDTGAFFRSPLHVIHVLTGALIMAVALSAISSGFYWTERFKGTAGQLVGSGGSLLVLVVSVFSVGLALVAFVGASIVWKRRKDLRTEDVYGSDFIVPPLVAHMIRTAGEAFGVMLALLGILASLLVTLLSLLVRVKDMIPWLDLGELSAVPITGIVLAPLVGFLIVLVTRWIAETIHVAFAIANNTRNLRTGVEPATMPANRPRTLPAFHMDLALIAWVIAALLLVFLPATEGWLLLLTAGVMVHAWRIGWRWTFVLLVGVFLHASLIWLAAHIEVNDPSDLHAVFLGAAVRTEWLLRLLSLLAAVMLFVERAGLAGERPDTTRSVLYAAFIALLVLAYPVFATLQEAARRHTLTELERTSAMGLLKAQEGRAWTLILQEDTAQRLDMHVAPLAIAADRYGTITYAHRIAVGRDTLRTTFEGNWMNIRLPVPVIYPSGSQSVQVDYAAADSLTLKVVGSDGRSRAFYVGLPTALLEARRKAASQEQRTEAVADSAAIALKEYTGRFVSFHCGTECLARFTGEGADAVQLTFLSRFQQYGKVVLATGFGADLGDVTNAKLVGRLFKITARRGPAASGNVTEEITGLEEVVEEPAPRPVAPATAPVSERTAPASEALPSSAELSLPPEYPGGAVALRNYLRTNMRYPEADRVQGIAGRVLIGCVVEEDGSLSALGIARSVSPALDQEALRLVRAMPAWVPGEQAGKPVRCRHTIEVNFRFN
ncbi:MAG: energy transducer TonB [Flavobacteriales bacterium]|nr:energy transducer TonB [Flavobacteriales bacterium]